MQLRPVLSPVVSSVFVVFVSLAIAQEPQDVSKLLAPLVEKHKVPALAVIEGDRLTKVGATGIRARREPGRSRDVAEQRLAELKTGIAAWIEVGVFERRFHARRTVGRTRR